MHHCGQQRRQLPGLGMPANQGRFAGHAVPGQLHHPSAGQTGQVHATEAEGCDLRHPVQREGHRPARGHDGALTQAIQVRRARARGHVQECFELAGLGGRRDGGQGVPESLCGFLADPPHEPCERAGGRQQHLALPQPDRRGVKEHPGAVTGDPGAVVDPAGKLALGIGDVPPAVLPGDLPLVLKAGLLPANVRLETRGVRDGQLLGEVVDHLRRHVEGIGEEGAEVAEGDQLQAEAEPVGVAPPFGDQPAVDVVEEVVPLEVQAARGSGKPAVPDEVEAFREAVFGHASNGSATGPSRGPTPKPPKSLSASFYITVYVRVCRGRPRCN